jgi:hypothetical protein
VLSENFLLFLSGWPLLVKISESAGVETWRCLGCGKRLRRWHTAYWCRPCRDQLYAWWRWRLLHFAPGFNGGQSLAFLLRHRRNKPHT